MRSSAFFVLALSAAAFAAPTTPSLSGDAAAPRSIDAVSDYFNLLARKVTASKDQVAPKCNVALAQLPVASPTPLPKVSDGLYLKHVAVGRGTQNYTCDLTNATAVPVQIGAVATLFNASCVAAVQPDVAAAIPRVAVQFNLTSSTGPLAPSNLPVTGHHYFTTTTTPFFDLNTPGLSLGSVPCSKNNSVAAPTDAPTGQTGEKAVPWLKLLAKDGATGGLAEVYRVDTAGGSAPATCAGMPASFQVQYSALYYFYAR